MTMIELDPAQRRERYAKVMWNRAVHEAGHAVFLWRGYETIYGKDWWEDAPQFDEIVLSPHLDEFVGCELIPAPPLELSDGRVLDVGGVVTGVVGYRVTLPMVRRDPIGVMGRVPRRVMRARVRHITVATRVLIEHKLAGPIAEFWDHEDRATGWIWQWEEEDEKITATPPSNGGEVVPTDLASALSYAAEIFPPAPSGRHTKLAKLMDAICDSIAAKLRDDPRYWRTINALADTLVNHPRHRLDGEEAVDVMKAAWNAS